MITKGIRGAITVDSNTEEAIEKEIGIRTTKPDNPLFVTPLGIALSCTDEALN